LREPISASPRRDSERASVASSPFGFLPALARSSTMPTSNAPSRTDEPASSSGACEMCFEAEAALASRARTGSTS
jgi:hypothetical protein